MKKNIILTGGGTAGHVMPNIALFEDLAQNGWNIHYIGSYDGIEQQLITAQKVPYHGIASGKLRRYFSLKNFTDPFKVLWGLAQAFFIVRCLKPQVIFSKGGFVTLPVVIAGYLNRVPVIIHESDLTPGLANRLGFRFASKIALTFEASHLPEKLKGKKVTTGLPIRKELLEGNAERGLSLCGLDNSKPCILFIGGSLGASKLNQQVRAALPELLKHYHIIHICGQGKLNVSIKDKNYYQLEFAKEILPDLFAASDVIVSRAGANSIYEILMLQKPHVFIPLSARVSRGDQVENAAYFERQGISTILDDDHLNAEKLVAAIGKVYIQRDQIKRKMQALALTESNIKTIALIESLTRAQ